MADTGHGASITNATSAWVGAFRSIGGLTQSVPALDDSDLANSTYVSKVRGDVIDLGAIECEIFFDPDDPPPIDAAQQTWVLNFPLPPGASEDVPAKISGTGFLTETTSPELVTNQLMMGSFSLQFDGQTGPLFTDKTNA